STTLLKGINLCLNATASDQLRLIMTCIYLDVHEDYINFAATDGRKLVRFTNTSCKPGMTTSMIMPKTVAAVLRNTLTPEADLVFTFDKQQAQLHTEDLDFSFRLVEGNYLNYNAVIPTSNPFCATVDRASLLGAMKRVSVFCNQSSGLTKMHIGGGLVKLSAQDVDYGRQAEENLLCEYTNSPINIGLNCFFVMDMISVLDSEHISVQLADASRPAVIAPIEQPEGDEVVMLIMPMMLND
ncbi:MAG: DNA polymerase III subunit beta, partial [Prevotellaceae bacterium]|nr:DNA polymerase III subunit beta [Prevotellaceae bacterium]